MPGEGNIALEDPRIAASGKKNSSAKNKKETAAAPKDGVATGDVNNESTNAKARKRTKTGCLSKR